MLSRRAKKQGSASLNIVFFGGGGGSEAVLRALWKLARIVVAIIAVSDSGGDSGRIRQGLGWAPGDVRRALAAMAADPMGLMARLFRVRFDERFPERAGQSFGNTVFAAAKMAGLDMAGQMEAVARLLGVTGRVYPATYGTVGMVAEMEDGAVVCGEAAIAEYGVPARRVRLDPEQAPPPAEAIQAIAAADVIILGPGSVATSLLPTLIPSAEAVSRSRAIKFLIVNAWNEGDGDTSSAADYVRFIAGHFPGRRLFDCVLCHQATKSSPAGEDGRRPVEADLGAIRAMGYDAVGADLLAPDGRHDGARVADLVARLAPTYSRQPPVHQAEKAGAGSLCLSHDPLSTRRTSCRPTSELPCRALPPCRALRRLAPAGSGAQDRSATRRPVACRGGRRLRRSRSRPSAQPAAPG